MPRFSANLGFLWTELALPDAIRAAKEAGFDAVETHWPYDVPVEDVKAALIETGLPMLGINTVRGDVQAGETGLTALAGREREARDAIDQAIGYASAIDAANVHVMAGNLADGAEEKTFLDNLRYASDRAAEHNIVLVIEPINRFDMPDYFLKTSDQAVALIEAAGRANIRLLYDCYHMQIMEGDISRRVKELLPLVGHIQFAAVPSRAEPDEGELNYRHIFAALDRLGYDRPLGAEYKPRGKTEDGLGWMKTLA